MEDVHVFIGMRVWPEERPRRAGNLQGEDFWVELKIGIYQFRFPIENAMEGLVSRERAEAVAKDLAKTLMVPIEAL